MAGGEAAEPSKNHVNANALRPMPDAGRGLSAVGWRPWAGSW
jgi:hypothetical protein